MESGVHSHLHQRCYEREIWHYKYANTDLIQRVVKKYPWEKSLAEEDVNEDFCIFAKTCKIIFLEIYSTRNNSL